MSAKLFALTSLLAFASALPSGARTLSPRQKVDTECWRSNPGTNFYRCDNGYVGCFKGDPCALPPLSSSTSTPSFTPKPKPTPTPAPKIHEITKPRSYNIYILDDAQHNVQDPVPHVDLNKPKGSKPTTTNAMIFEDLPAGAKNCRLNWRSTTPNDENMFTVSGNGQAWTRQLTGWPSAAAGEKVSFDGLKKYQDPEAEWTPSLDFTNWPQSPSDHVGPAMKCGESVALEIKGSDDGGEEDAENRVFITLTETNGLYLTYEL